ncbi:hypothetical protein JKA74_06995 [Marivirga sp. S37H4]|uniref:Uncharacterized protein n=1 Tax=Marivirga aurantiaca TaxID=2802615 RepID=A0A935C872_9BACT|nr:hypothetical protein [Marivirga aurantiaca]MBK6264777.1 hypothetical protein [Marivirga aurantiaca]
MSKFLTVLIILSVSFLKLSFSQNISGLVDEALTHSRTGKSLSAIQWNNYTQEEHRLALDQLKKATADSVVAVRQSAYRMQNDIYQSATNEDFKSDVVDSYSKGLDDKDVSVQLFVAEGLMSFQAQHFNEAVRTFLVQKLNPIPAYYEDLVITLASIDERKAIAPIIDHIRYQFSDMEQMQKWQAHIALSRMGEKPALDYIVKKAKALPVNEEVVYEIYPTLAFTKKKAAVNVLVEQVFNDEKNCPSPDPNTNKNISCAYRILEIIAPIIKDFPLPYDSASGDLMVDDYEKALKTARKWLKSNKDTYELI